MDHRGANGNPSGERPVLAFLGPESSYSHQATMQTFSQDDWDFRPARTIGDVFEAVQRGEATLGVVPLENSTNGPVIFTFDTLADRDNLFRDICVCGEIYFDVHHYLVGRLPPRAPMSAIAGFVPDDIFGGGTASGSGSGTCTPTPSDPHPRPPRAKPVSSLAHIRRIYSHPQAFGQCTAFLSTYLKSAEVFDVSSTSRAAEIVAGGDGNGNDGDGTWAAISSEIAAGINGLDILARCIEDREDNTTRFFVIRKGPGDMSSHSPTPPALSPSPGYPGHAPSASGSGSPSNVANPSRTKSMVSFTVPHHSPGALADALEGFRKSGLNLTSINSRPSLIEPFQYVFFVEFEGHKLRDPEGRVERALERVAAVAQRWRWLGSWEVQR